MRLPNLKNKGVSGFTLVEMAIVLVIIGIILAGVMKGRDIVRGAQVKQFSQQFAQKWGTVAQTYYDKTGQFLNDGEINGGVAAVVSDGRMDGLSLGTAQSTNLITTLQSVGIEPCSLVKSKLVEPVVNVNVNANTVVCSDGTDNVTNIWQAMVEGEYSGAVLVEVDLVNLEMIISENTVRRNCVVLYGVPTDVAQGLDTAIDGRNNAAAGSCVAIADPAGVGTVSTTLTEGQDVTGDMPNVWGNASDTGNTGIQDMAIVLDY